MHTRGKTVEQMKPSTDWSITEIAGWFEQNTEKNPSAADEWCYKPDCSLDIDESIRMIQHLIEESVKLRRNKEEVSSDRGRGTGGKAQSDLEAKLAEQETQIAELRQTENTRSQQLSEKEVEIQQLRVTVKTKDSELLKKQTEIANLKKDLQSRQKTIDELNEKLNKPSSLWSWLAQKFPNFFSDGEAKIEKLENEVKTSKVNIGVLQQQVSKANESASYWKTQHDSQVAKLQQEKKRWEDEKKRLDEETGKLREMDAQRTAEIARLSATKEAESLGDYEKREGYQVIIDYKAFCTQQSLDVITEDVYDYLRQRKEELKDGSRRDFFIAQTKTTLSKAFLMNVYKEQIRQLRKQQSLIEFDPFFESYGKNLISQMELSEKLIEQLKKTAKKGFDLVNQLVQITPTCHLVIADNGDEFNSEEHELAAGCPEDGIVEFTVVPGVLSGHRFLMKPIVYTVPYDPVRDKA